MEENQPITSKKPMNKAEIIAALGEATGLTKQQVAGVFDELAGLIRKNLDEQGPGVFTIPDLLQIKVVRKPATEERKGINPFTKEEMIVKAKPATNSVKLVPLKGLKAMVQSARSEATTISAKSRQADRDDGTNMVSEGGPSNGQ
jgi:nucleoid DNA-binding protein